MTERSDKHRRPTPASSTPDALQIADILRRQGRRDHADPLGSYTGTDADDERPEQDVDDL